MRTPISKLIDPEYAPKILLTQAVQGTFEPNAGLIWNDSACKNFRFRRTDQQKYDFPPVFAWEIADVFLTYQFVLFDDQHIYMDSSQFWQGNAPGQREAALAFCSGKASLSDSHGVVHDAGGDPILIMHNEGGGTWGHYLIQNFPKALLFLAHYPTGRIALPSVYVNKKNSYSQVFQIYGITEDRLLPIEQDKTYKIGKAVIVDFMRDTIHHSAAHPRLRELMQLQNYLADADQTKKNVVFIERAPKNRGIGNIEDVKKIIALFGIKPRVLGSETLIDQIKAWQGAKLVISTLGSDLTNIIFAGPGTRVLSISPEWFGDRFFADLARMKDVEWNELICGAHTSSDSIDRFSNFQVDTAALKNMISNLL